MKFDVCCLLLSVPDRSADIVMWCPGCVGDSVAETKFGRTVCLSEDDNGDPGLLQLLLVLLVSPLRAIHVRLDLLQLFVKINSRVGDGKTTSGEEVEKLGELSGGGVLGFVAYV